MDEDTAKMFWESMKLSRGNDSFEPHKPTESSTTTSNLKGASARKTRTGSLSSSSGIIINVSNCKYESVRRVANKIGWVLEEEEDEADMSPEAKEECGPREDWNVYWTDVSVSQQRAMRLKPYQKLNHFPGMSNLARKGGLGRHLTRLAKIYPLDFNFFPQTFVLPGQWNEFKEQIDSGKGNRTYIIKPDASCQGKGIFLTRTYEGVNPTENQVAQRYLHKPLLIDGYKFDMRVYVLVTNVNPLRIFRFTDGLVRICTEKYVEPKSKNLGRACVHLTNYAINKNHQDFVYNKDEHEDGTGNKRSLIWFWKWLRETYGEETCESLEADMNDMITKSLISVQPLLAHTYRSSVKHSFRRNSSSSGAESFDGGSDRDGESSTGSLHHPSLPTTITTKSSCFELLGFDVMVDRNFKPWLIEVNHSPSFAIDTPLDAAIKTRLIEKTLGMINVSSLDKKKAKMKTKMDSQSRLYRRPSKDSWENGANNHTNNKETEAEFQKILDNEEKHIEDGSFVRVYPTNDAKTNAYYDPYLETSKSLFHRSTQTRSHSARSTNGKRGLSPRAKLIKKAQEYGMKIPDNNREEVVTPNVVTKRKTYKPPPRPMQSSRHMSDLEKFKQRGLQRKSMFNTYLRRPSPANFSSSNNALSTPETSAWLDD